MSKQAAVMQKNMNLYLAPEQLTANEANDKARPAETTEQRFSRIKAMADSIAANGQEYPVMVVEIESDGVTTYEYVDGGCRVEAIARLNDTDGGHRDVWCTLVDPTEDLFRKAITSNLHRTQNSLLDMAYIVMESRERNNWAGRGSGKKVAEYLGIQESRVSEYEKLLRASAPVKARIESGEIASLDAALKLMAVPEEEQGRVAERAVELADEDEKRERKGKPATEKKSKPKIKAKHVAEAAREVTDAVSPRAKSEIAEFFEQVTEAAYPAPAVKFADYFVQKWMKGEGTDKHARELFDTAVGLKAASGKVKLVKPKVVKPKKAKKAKKEKA